MPWAPRPRVVQRLAGRLLWAACLAGLLSAGPVAAAAPLAPEAIDRLEDRSRAHPEAVADEIQALLSGGPIEGATRLDLEHLLGMVRAAVRQPGAAEAVATALADPQATVYRQVPQAQRAAAAACVRAQVAQMDGGSLARAEAQLDAVEADLRAIASPRVRLRCLATAGAIKDSLGRTDEAVRLYQEAIRLADDGGLAWRRSGMRSSLAYALYRGGQTEHATRLNEEARRIAAEASDWMSLSGVATTESILLTHTERPKEELAALNAAIEYARRAGAAREEALGLANLSDFYLQSGDYRRALEIAQRAVPLAHALRDATTENLARLNSGLALISLRRKDEGMALIRPVLEFERAANDLASLAESTRDMAEYLERAGYLAEAYAGYQALRGLSGELARRDQQQAVLELQEAFDAQQRRRELELLKEDSALKEEQLRRQELEFKVWLLTAVLVLSLLALAGRMYRSLRATQRALRQSTAQLKLHSLQDPLTGLANRRRFHELTDGDRPFSPARGALYLLDLDHFKRINDLHGHAAGDEVLVEIARRLRAILREEDMVVRWGGEEFMVLVPGMGSDQVVPLARRMLHAVAGTPVALPGGGALQVTTSIGFAEFPLGEAVLEMPWGLAVDVVDNAMYMAKTLGRNRACGLGRVPAASLDELDAVVHDLERAARDGRVQLTLVEGPLVVGEGP
ncbi:diguanylate cyclase [Ideonella sp.]|uniref:diguanylate cyclase n=1 Tax=Ideonella sp. TaxID=1929293 RepID=UPI0035B181EE